MLINNETLGISCEIAICKIFNLNNHPNINRGNNIIINKLIIILKDYFDKKKTSSLNDNSVLVPLKNRLGKTQNESYDDVVNSYLKKYLLEMDVRRDPREIEGVVDQPDIDNDEPVEDVNTASDNEEECESAAEGCSCNECPACRANQHKDEPNTLTFYYGDLKR